MSTTKLTLPGRALLELADTHDLALACDDRTVTAHRNILALASPVLHRLLFGEMRPPVENGLTTLRLPGKSARLMKRFVEAAYVGEESALELEEDPTLSLLACAHEYDFQALKRRVEDRLVANLDAETTVDMILYARQYECPKLEAAARRWSASPRWP